MPRFRVAVQIVPREGLLDPQGAAVAGALRTLGFGGTADVRVGRFIVVSLDAPDASTASATVRDMCIRLLANPVTEDFTLEEPARDEVAAS